VVSVLDSGAEGPGFNYAILRLFLCIFLDFLKQVCVDPAGITALTLTAGFCALAPVAEMNRKAAAAT